VARRRDVATETGTQTTGLNPSTAVIRAAEDPPSDPTSKHREAEPLALLFFCADPPPGSGTYSEHRPGSKDDFSSSSSTTFPLTRTARWKRSRRRALLSRMSSKKQQRAQDCSCLPSSNPIVALWLLLVPLVVSFCGAVLSFVKLARSLEALGRKHTVHATDVCQLVARGAEEIGPRSRRAASYERLVL
jgi:hypothetical protein